MTSEQSRILAAQSRLVSQLAVHPSNPTEIIDRACRDLDQIVNPADLSRSMESIEIKQTRGPTVRFTGRLLCQEEFETRGRDPIRAIMEVWESQAGALIAVDRTERMEGGGTERVAVLVVKTGDDEQVRRFAVMEHFGWSSRARKMVGKALGWKLTMEVE